MVFARQFCERISGLDFLFKFCAPEQLLLSGYVQRARSGPGVGGGEFEYVWSVRYPFSIFIKLQWYIYI